jgi:membrane protein DedA with SNARE-associated domain
VNIDHAKLADAGAITSGTGWFLSHALQAVPVIQDLAGIIAIIAGLCAARYHWLKAREIKDARKG